MPAGDRKLRGKLLTLKNIHFISRGSIFAGFLYSVITVCGCAPSRPESAGYISLSPAVTEIIYCIGAEDQLLARTGYCDWPPEALKKPIVGSFDAPSVELISSLNPEVIFSAGAPQSLQTEKLSRLGFNIISISPSTVEELLNSFLTVGRATGRISEAASAAAALKKKLEEASVPVSSDSPRVYAEISADPMMAAGSRSYLNGIIELSGGVNAASLDKDYFITGYEYLIRSAPDIVLLLEPRAGREERIRRSLGPEGERIRIVSVKNPDIYIRPGPRIDEAVRELAAIISQSSDE